MPIKELVKTGLIKLVIVLLAVFVFTIIFPTLVVVYIPVYFYRSLVTKLSELFRPDLLKILPPHSATYAATGSETNVVLYLKLKKPPPNSEDLNDWKWKFYEKVILAKRKCPNSVPESHGEFLYPEFQQCIVVWCGFPFWKVDQQFSIDNHISSRSYSSESDLRIIEIELLRTPCKKLQSPWELVICQTPDNSNNSTGDFSVFFKFHHSLADGHSIFNALMNLADVPIIASTTVKKVAPFPVLQHFSVFPFKGAYDLAKTAIEHQLAGTLWTNFKRENKSELRVYLKSKLLDTQNLKRTSANLKVHFTAVLIETITRGVKKFLDKSESAGGKIPEYIVCPMPMPARRTSDGLQNAFTVGCLKIPFQTEDSAERLKLCEINLQETKSSCYGTVAFLMLRYIGKLPLCFLRKQPPMMEPLFFSNFAGPRAPLSLNGCEILDMSFSANFSKCNPVVLTVLTYNGKVRIGLNVDNNLLSNESSVEELLRDIEDEF